MGGKNIEKLIRTLNMSVMDFEKKIGVTINRIQKSIERDSNIKSDLLEKILKKYPAVNEDWLLTGKGEMFNTDLIDRQNEAIRSIGGNNEIIKSPFGTGKKKNGEGLIPYYEVDFMAGNSMEFYEDSTITPAYFMDIPEFRGCTAFRAYSDSMEDLIKSGNILFGTRVEDWRSHLEYGQIYGITMMDKRRYLKFIRKSNSPANNFLLKSRNSDYDDFDIPKNKIKNIWLIEGWLNRRT